MNQRRARSAQPAVAVRSSRSCLAPTDRFHLRKSAPEMIPATATAIPTARTHQAPRPTVVTRTTFSILSPSSAPRDNGSAPTSRPGTASPWAQRTNSRGRSGPTAAVPHQQLRQTHPQTKSDAYRQTSPPAPPVAPRYVDPFAAATIPTAPVWSPREERPPQHQDLPSSTIGASAVRNKGNKRLERALDLVLSRNRALEMQVLALQRDVMELKAANGSMDRLMPQTLPRQVTKKQSRKLRSSSEPKQRHLQRIDAPEPLTPFASQQSEWILGAHRRSAAEIRQPADTVDDDEAFAQMERAYWQQSQLILEDLSRRLHDMSRVSGVSSHQISTAPTR